MQINPYELTDAGAKAALDEACKANDAAQLVAGISKGATQKRAMAIAAAHHRNALALADRIYGTPEPLSDSELLAALSI